MATGYDQHFKKQREISKKKSLVARPKKKFVQHIDFTKVTIAFIGFAMSSMAYLNIDKVSRFLSRVEVRPSSAAHAESANSANSAKSEETSGKETKEGAKEIAQQEVESDKNEKSETKPKPKAEKEEQSYYTELKARKEALDLRQEELDRREKEFEELNRKLSAKIENLDKKRREIASLLENRIEIDGQKLSQLVEIYSSMKFENAAKIIETLDTELAVALLGKMKKKSAASILNVMDPKKAQLLSEKYTGYK